MNITPGLPYPPGGGSYPPYTHDRVHYDRGGVLVTSTWVKVHGRSYPVADLRHLRTMRSPYSGLTINASLVVVVLLICIARIWDYLDADAWIGVLAVLVVVVGLAIIGTRLHRRIYVLIAEFHGHTVLLLWDENRERYGQISRAILRAREAQGPR